jgi:hypothetical protein
MATGRVSITWTGMRELASRLQLDAIAVPKALATALYQEGLRIMAVAIRITPWDTGTLRSTGHVELPSITGTSIVVKLGFGGSSAPYALYVHENLQARHKPGTQAKFLETPVRAMAPEFAKSMGLAVKL